MTKLIYAFLDLFGFIVIAALTVILAYAVKSDIVLVFSIGLIGGILLGVWFNFIVYA